MRACCCFSHFWLFVTLWSIACQAPLSMGFSRQEYWNMLPCSVLFLFFFVNLPMYLSILLTFQRTWIWFHHFFFFVELLIPILWISACILFLLITLAIACFSFFRLLKFKLRLFLFSKVSIQSYEYASQQMI